MCSGIVFERSPGPSGWPGSDAGRGPRWSVETSVSVIPACLKDVNDTD